MHYGDEMLKLSRRNTHLQGILSKIGAESINFFCNSQSTSEKELKKKSFSTTFDFKLWSSKLGREAI